MIIIYEMIIYSIFIFFKVYYYFDNYVFLSESGSKMNKYISSKNLNFEFNSNKRFTLNITYFKNSLINSIPFLLIKIILTNKFLFSTFYPIKVIDKMVDIATIFGDNYYMFKVVYYIFSYIIIAYIIYYYYLYKDKYNIKNNKDEDKIANTDAFNLGVCNDKNIYIPKNGLYQNILITGSIGSGKTSSAISNLTEYLISSKMSGLIIDVKGNYIDKVKKIASKYDLNDKIIEISLDSNTKYNPINDYSSSPIEIAHMIVKVLKLLSDNNNSDSFWFDKVETYLKDFIIIIKTYNDCINFNEIHKLINSKDYLKEKLNKVKDYVIKNNVSDDKLFEINNSISNIKNEFLKLDERTSSIIKSEVTRITDIFSSDYNIFNQFCSNSKSIDFKDNKIYVLSLNISKHRKLAKVIASYLKLDFQNYVLKGNKKNIFFIADEYQEIVNKEDAHFFSLSREFKCINIVSMQSYSSILNTLKSKDTANVIIQNFVNKIWFRNDDNYTNEEVIKQIGKEEKEKLTFNINENSKETKFNLITNNFKNDKSNLTEGYNITKNNENILEVNYFSTILKNFEVCSIISDGNSSKLYKKVNLKINNI